MKKIVSLFCLCLLSFFAFANERGHFFVDLTSQNVSLSSITSFSSYADLPNGTTFELFRDTIDELGIRHQSYQQYFNGNLVQSKIILVHSSNGKVRYIHGAIMDSNSAPKTVSAPISRKSAVAKAPQQVPEEEIETIIFCLEGQYYHVYKVQSPKSLETLYIDIASGNIIYRESAIHNADVTIRGLTRYQGWQNMTADEQDGKYFLLDNGRNMVTMAAGLQGPDLMKYLSPEYMATLPPEVLSALGEGLYDPNSKTFVEAFATYVYGPMMTDYITQGSTTIYSEQSEFYMPYLTTITISSASSSWWYDSWDTKPDLYFKIYDEKGNLIQTTTARQDCNLPATFKLSTPILLTEEGYVIKIYDEDVTSDSYGGSVILTSITYGTKTWSSSNTSGSVVIEAKPSEYCDIHWGMQKTLDFYLQKFNRNSYDGEGGIVINLAFPPYDDMVFKIMPNNAAAQHTFQPYFMYYGYGDGNLMNPVVSVDVMSHEFTHMVTNCNGNGGLEYKEESGALNESFSDCLAMAVTKYAIGTCPWTIGADVMVQTSNLRSMSNPKNSNDAQSDTLRGAQPDTYKGQCWSYMPATIDTTQELVHRNSGVMNHWFYILSEGKSGKNDNQYSYNVTGIGIDKATAITYRNLIYYLTPCATFADARLGSLIAAADLYGATSVEYKTVGKAWDAVGVIDYEEPTPPTPTNEYYIVAKRSTGNYYFFTPNKVEGKNRLIAVDAGTSVRSQIDTVNTTDAYLWTLEDSGTGKLLKSHNGEYLTCTAAKSAIMSPTGIVLNLTNNNDGTVTFSYAADASTTHYLSLANAGYDYFVFYANAHQVTHLLLMPKGDGTTLTNNEELYVTPNITNIKKVMYDGQLYILRGNKLYNAVGRRVK